MSIKGKIISLIVFFFLTITLLVVGVWAVTDTDFKVKGDIEYVAPQAEDVSTYTDLTFTLNEQTRTASVSGNNKSATSITIPAVVSNNGKLYKVNEIEEKGFFSYNNLASISIPDTIEIIGWAAFSYCNALTYTEYEGGNYLGNSENPYLMLHTLTTEDLESVIEFTSIHEDTQIVYETFWDCINLTKVNFPDALKTIGYSAFLNCVSLAEIKLPNSLIRIDEYAFSYCSSLTEISIPYSVKSIKETSFSCCSSVKKINVDDRNKVYDDRNGCGAIIETSSNTIVLGCVTTKIPNTISAIGAYAFAGSELSSIDIPDYILSVGEFAFAECYNLKNVAFGTGISEIVDYAFSGAGLTSVSIPSYIKRIGKYSFSCCPDLVTVTIENGVEEIQEAAFSESGLTEVTIPSSVKFVGIEAFSYCESLKKVIIEHGVAKILSACFTQSAVEEIYIPSTLQSLNFDGCKKLKTIIIESGVTRIHENSFLYCNSIEDIYFIGSEEEWNAITIEATNLGNATVHFIDSTQSSVLEYSCDSATMTAEITGQNIAESTYLKIPEYVYNNEDGKIYTVTSIASGANNTSGVFYNCTNLTGIEVPTTFTKFGNYAFNGCTNIAEVNYLGDVNGWASITFGNTRESNPAYFPKQLKIKGEVLTALVIDTATKVSAFAFYYCTNFTSLTLGDQVIEIGTSCFTLLNNLTSVDLGNGLKTIGSSVFNTCNKLTSVVIPASVTSIQSNMFVACSALSSIVVEEGNTVYDSRDNCNAIINSTSHQLISGCKTTVIPETVLSLANACFQGISTTLFTTLVIPANVRSIGDYALYTCTQLESIVLPASLQSIGFSAFQGSTNLTNVYFTGTQEQWDAITIGANNEPLLNATLTCGYTPA